MTLYNIFGTLNTLIIFVSLYGVYAQLGKLWQRKKSNNNRQQPSELLSLNQFLVSFLAYFSFFIYGYSIEPFNHYIVWPRLIASILVGLILYEIWRDRQNQRATLCLISAVIIFILGCGGFFYGNRFADESRLISTSLIVVVTLLIAQGYYHQIMLIIRCRKTGAIELKMSQFTQSANSSH